MLTLRTLRVAQPPRSSGGGRHGGACKSAWRRDALPTLSPAPSLPPPGTSAYVHSAVHGGGGVPRPLTPPRWARACCTRTTRVVFHAR